MDLVQEYINRHPLPAEGINQIAVLLDDGIVMSCDRVIFGGFDRKHGYGITSISGDNPYFSHNSQWSWDDENIDEIIPYTIPAEAINPWTHPILIEPETLCYVAFYNPLMDGIIHNRIIYMACEMGMVRYRVMVHHDIPGDGISERPLDKLLYISPA